MDDVFHKNFFSLSLQSRFTKSSANYVIFQLVNTTPFFIKLRRSSNKDAQFPDQFRDDIDLLAPLSINSANMTMTTYESRSSDFDLFVDIYKDGEEVGHCGSS